MIIQFHPYTGGHQLLVCLSSGTYSGGGRGGCESTVVGSCLLWQSWWWSMTTGHGGVGGSGHIGVNGICCLSDKFQAATLLKLSRAQLWYIDLWDTS